MDQIIDKCLRTLGIADDVAAYGNTKTEHNHHLNNLMKVARDNGLVFNREKCATGQESINFVGMVSDGQRVDPDPERV